MCSRFLLLITKDADRITLNSLHQQNICSMNPFLNKEPGKEAVFALCLSFPDVPSVESADPSCELDVVGRG